jgi:hypothetical protein
MRLMVRRMIGVAIWALASALGATAHGQGSAESKAAADALFKEAIGLMNAGDAAKACPKLEESQRLDPAVGTLLYLGECYEKQGRVASAWAAFNSAASAARAAKQAQREQTAVERAAALEPTLPKLVIEVPAEARMAGLQIVRDGVLVGEASFGVPVPLDPGEHSIKASAPGKKGWSQTVQLTANGAATKVSVPMLTLGEADSSASQPAEPVTTAPPTAPAAKQLSGANGAAAAAEDDTSQEGGAGNAQLISGIVIGGVGIVGLVVGAVFGAQAKSKESDSEQYCRPSDPTLCSDEASPEQTTSARVSVQPLVGPAVAGLGLVGSW